MTLLIVVVAVVWVGSSVNAEAMAPAVDRAASYQDVEVLLAKRGHGKGHPGKGPGNRGKRRSEEESGQGHASKGEQGREHAKEKKKEGEENNGPGAAHSDAEHGGEAAKDHKKLKHQEKKTGLDRADEAAGEHGEHGRSKARGPR